MNDILTLRQVSNLLKINSTKNNPNRNITRFLRAIQKQRNIQVLFKHPYKRKYYTTLTALKNAIPELFQDVIAPPKQNPPEDISEETLETIRELTDSLKEQIHYLRSNNKYLQEQFNSLNYKYQDLELKYNNLIKKITFNKKK